MNITQEKVDRLNSLVKIQITPADYQERVDKAIKEQAKKAKLPGFRPGMVPTGHIKRMYGKSILVDEINNLLNDTLNKYIEENKLEVLGQPLPKMDDNRSYNWDFTDEFEFIYELGLAPDFDVQVSSKDVFPNYIIKVDEETLESRIKNIRRSYGKMTNPEVSADGDVLAGELKQIAADGSVFEEGFNAEKASIRLDLVKDEAIKNSLIGLKTGDEVLINLKKALQDDAQVARILGIEEEEAAQLFSDHRLTVRSVSRLEESDLNQEFYDKLFGEGTVTTEEEFRSKIREELESMLVQNAEQRLQNDLYTFFMSNVQLELPDEFLKKWLKTTNTNLKDEEIEEGYADFAKNLRWSLIENKVIRDNNIEIKYEDVFQTAKKRIDAQFRMYSPQPVPEEQLAQYTVQFLQNKENANRIFDEVKAQKVFEYLRGVVTLDNREIEYNKFLELQ